MNILKNVISVIFLGALGSGLWSLIGEPFLDWLLRTFITLANSVNIGYYDLLHADIGKGFHETYGLFFSTLFLMVALIVILLLPYFAYRGHKKISSLDLDRIKIASSAKAQTDEEKVTQLKEKIARANEKLAHLKKKGQMLTTVSKYVMYISPVLSLISLPVYLSMIVTNIYNSQAIVFSERAIEIISPRIENAEILQLRAMYRSVEDANSFYAFYDEIERKFIEKKVTLPKFEVAR